MAQLDALEAQSSAFHAYPSRMQALVAIAAFLPLVVAGFLALPLGPDVPLWLRIVGLMILAPILVLLAMRIKLLFVTRPSIDISDQGIVWRGWSDSAIPWTAIARWETRTYLGSQQATFWLHDPSAYPASTINGLINPGNKLLGFGDLTFNTSGTNRNFSELVTAVRKFELRPRVSE